ncbi:MAG: thermonuclease family protein [Allorhizobium sp.]
MRRIGTFIAGAIGLLLWAYLVVQAGESLREDPVDYNIEDLDVPDPSELDLPEVGLADDEMIEPAPQAEARRAVRAIEPEVFGSPAFTDSGDLERVAARAPLSPVEERARPKVVLLHRPLSLSAGIVAFNADQRIRLADIAETDPDRTCVAEDGTSWPCGVMARTQQRLFLRNRSLSCETGSTAWQGEIRTRCWVGVQDVSSWLAKYGWAEAEPGSALAVLSEEARAAKRGLFGDPVR